MKMAARAKKKTKSATTERSQRAISRTKLKGVIARAERASRVKLSRSARDMLIIPLLEERSRTNLDEAETSIRAVIDTISVEERGRLGRAIDVIRAFHERFCNIPPFCSRRPGSARPRR
jgi:hypothetical protein